jgi:hypothetical protein
MQLDLLSIPQSIHEVLRLIKLEVLATEIATERVEMGWF